MGRKCSVYGCKTGYQSQVNQEKIRIYKFPTKVASYILRAWLDSLPNLIKPEDVTDNMGVCALHWPESAPFIRRGRHMVPAVPPTIFQIFEKSKVARASASASTDVWNKRNNVPSSSPAQESVPMETPQPHSDTSEDPPDVKPDLDELEKNFYPPVWFPNISTTNSSSTDSIPDADNVATPDRSSQSPPPLPHNNGLDSNNHVTQSKQVHTPVSEQRTPSLHATPPAMGMQLPTIQAVHFTKPPATDADEDTRVLRQRLAQPLELAEWPRSEGDQFDAYGKFLAHKLRNLARDQRIHVQKIIGDTMYEAELGALSRQSRLVVGDMSVTL